MSRNRSLLRSLTGDRRILAADPGRDLDWLTPTRRTGLASFAAWSFSFAGGDATAKFLDEPDHFAVISAKFSTDGGKSYANQDIAVWDGTRKIFP